MKRALLLLATLFAFAIPLALACNTVRIDPEARFACPCLTGFVCGPDGFCIEEGEEGACTEPTCEALGFECGLIQRCGETVTCGTCADCGFLDPGRCGGCRAGETDLPDEHFYDRNCDGIDGDRSVALFVDPLGGDDANDGRSADAPIRTLPRILSLAAAQPEIQQVLISEGQLVTTGKILIDRDLSFFGRYSADAGWQRSPDFPRPVLQGSTVAMEHFGTRERSVSGIEIRPDPLGTNGYSSIGLLVLSPLRMWDVKIVTVSGKDWPAQPTAAAGATGATGGAGAGQATGGGANSVCLTPSGELALTASGGSGGLGQGSNVARGGEPSPGGSDGGYAGGVCSAPCEACPGQPGADGQPGLAGAAGAGGTGPGKWEAARIDYAKGQVGEPGGHGTGGGGGGGGGACSGGRGGGGGGGGAGGCGGAGGRAGVGGAHALGAVVIGSTLEAKDLEILLGGGGRGGGGGAGGAGGLGGRGGAGGFGTTGSPGGKGGDGGMGGSGGPGGSGAGGWVIGVWCANGGTLVDASDIRVDGGVPGEGGTGAGEPGAPGEAHAIYGCPGL